MPKPSLTKQEEKHIERHVEKHIDKQVSKHLLSKTEYFANQFKQHVTTAIIAAFSFLIALAWKDFIVHIVQLYFPDTSTDFITAIIITLIAFIGIYLVSSWAKKPVIITGETTTKG